MSSGMAPFCVSAQEAMQNLSFHRRPLISTVFSGQIYNRRPCQQPQNRLNNINWGRGRTVAAAIGSRSFQSQENSRAIVAPTKTSRKNRRDEFARSFLIGKDVITRTEGMKLGSIGGMLVDTAAFEVVSLELNKGLPYLDDYQPGMPLSSLRQIGDVCLVHDSSVLDADIVANPGGLLVSLVGSVVETEYNQVLGKVS